MHTRPTHQIRPTHVGLRSILALTTALALIAVGCGGGGGRVAGPVSPDAVEVTALPPPAGGQANVPPVAEILMTALQDEYHARWTYERVLSDVGEVLPFSTVVGAERTHARSLEMLLRTRGLDVPPSDWTLENVPRFATLRDACAGAARAEADNVALYDRYLALELPADVRTVFTNLRSASASAHLPAFERCR